MRIAPCTVKAAMRRVREWHRHLPGVQGGLFAAACIDDTDACVGVAIAGNGPRAWMGTGRLVITRVAAQEDLPPVTDSEGDTHAAPACMMLLAALCRAAAALGYREAWTYTLPEEKGVSLRAAGFIDMGLTDGGEWDRPARPRRKAQRSDRKRRWLRRLGP